MADPLTIEQAREIALYPDRWSQYFRTINGQPFSLALRPYLIEIYRHFGPGKKNSKSKILVLKCSRKVEKTETLCNLLMYGLLNIPYFNAVYTAPRQPQVTRFVEERFNGALMSSVNNGCLMKSKVKSSVSHQTFNVGARSLNHFYAYSNWGDGEPNGEREENHGNMFHGGEWNDNPATDETIHVLCCGGSGQCGSSGCRFAGAS